MSAAATKAAYDPKQYRGKRAVQPAADFEPMTVGTNKSSAKDHALCLGPVVVAVVHGGGYPLGTGWAPHTAEQAARLAACWNACNGVSTADLQAGAMPYAQVTGFYKDAIAERDALRKALQELTDLGEHVPVFQLDDGKSSVKAVRLAGKFTAAMRKARAALESRT